MTKKLSDTTKVFELGVEEVEPIVSDANLDIEQRQGNILKIESDAIVVTHNNFFSWSNITGLQPALYRAMGSEASSIVKSITSLPQALGKM